MQTPEQIDEVMRKYGGVIAVTNEPIPQGLAP